MRRRLVGAHQIPPTLEAWEPHARIALRMESEAVVLAILFWIAFCPSAKWSFPRAWRQIAAVRVLRLRHGRAEQHPDGQHSARVANSPGTGIPDQPWPKIRRWDAPSGCVASTPRRHPGDDVVAAEAVPGHVPARAGRHPDISHCAKPVDELPRGGVRGNDVVVG